MKEVQIYEHKNRNNRKKKDNSKKAKKKTLDRPTRTVGVRHPPGIGAIMGWFWCKQLSATNPYGSCPIPR
jgi:hypothetical protein